MALIQSKWANVTLSRYFATLSWSGVGPYTMLINAATHNMGLNPIIQIVDTSGNVVYLDQINIDSFGNILLTSNDNIGGRVIIL